MANYIKHKYFCSMRIIHPDGTIKDIPFFTFEASCGIKHLECLATKYAKQGIKLEYENLTEIIRNRRA